MPIETDHKIALGYARHSVRDAFTILLQLDHRFAQIVKQSREPTLGQIKLQWWHDQLIAGRASVQAADPLLAQVFTAFHHHDVSFETIAGLTRGWSPLLEAIPLGREPLQFYAARRGAQLFEIAATIAGYAPTLDVTAAGAGWALTDFAFACHDKTAARCAIALANEQFAEAPQKKLGRDLRPFALLAHFAMIDARRGIDQNRQDSPRRRAFQALHFSFVR